MESLSLFFEPLEAHPFAPTHYSQQQMGYKIQAYTHSFPEMEAGHIALIGIGEERGHPNNQGCAKAANAIRLQLYKLSLPDSDIAITDLGNMKIGHSLNDTYSALANIIAQLIEDGITPLLLGGSQDLSYANYMAYEHLGQLMNICHIDEKFDMTTGQEQIDAQNYLANIVMRPGNKLFNLSNIAYQRHYEAPENIQLMQQLYFETHSLSHIRHNMPLAEAIMRQSDMLSLDLSALRYADAPGRAHSSPNGLFGEEICQIARYAGLSSQVSSFGIYEYNPKYDSHQTTAKLIAQIIWYFIEGRSQCINEHPAQSPAEQFRTYTVSFDNAHDDITFHKSKMTDRWWMEIKQPPEVQSIFKRHFFVACTYNEYQQALENDIPERWIKAYQKLM